MEADDGGVTSFEIERLGELGGDGGVVFGELKLWVFGGEVPEVVFDSDDLDLPFGSLVEVDLPVEVEGC